MPVLTCKNIIWLYFLIFFYNFFLFLNNSPEEKEELVQWMISNFEHTYLTNKAPFAINLNVAWFRTGEYFFEAFLE